MLQPVVCLRNSTRSSAYTVRSVLETRYARNGDLRVAYRTSREGPRDIVLIEFGSQRTVEVFPELPSIQGWVEAMTSLGRLIFFDQPGTGASDPVTPDALPTLEQWADSITAVLDDLGSSEAVLVAIDGALAPAALFAATHPSPHHLMKKIREATMPKFDPEVMKKIREAAMPKFDPEVMKKIREAVQEAITPEIATDLWQAVQPHNDPEIAQAIRDAFQTPDTETETGDPTDQQTGEEPEDEDDKRSEDGGPEDGQDESGSDSR